jgi:hypothetical protein
MDTNYNIMSAKITTRKTGGVYQIVGKLEGSASSGDLFIWHAPEDSSITIMFPPSGDPLGIGCTTIEANGKLVRDISLAKLSDPPPRNTYRYAIFCHKTNNFAVMNSDPEIIISD